MFILLLLLLFYYSEDALKCSTDEESFKIYESIPEPNKSVVGYIACFIAHLSKFADSTGVNDAAIANVFAPCLMRCPYTNVQEMIAATEKQAFFVLGLMDATKSLITSEPFSKTLGIVTSVEEPTDKDTETPPPPKYAAPLPPTVPAPQPPVAQ